MSVTKRGLLLGAIVFLFCAARVSAQSGTITGHLTATDTGKPVVEALVQVLTTDGRVVASTASNQDGVYRIAGVAPGMYAVTASAIGYGTQTMANVEVTAGGTAQADAALSPRAIELNTVVVSASRQQEKALDAPARVEVVNQREIEARPTVTPVDHIRNSAAVDVITQGLQSTNVVVRGFNNIFSGAVHALTDNRIAGVPSLAVNVLNFIPANSEDIERIEIVLGPGSALYGPNTANGVVHFITRSPLRDQGTVLSLSGGNRQVWQGQFRTAQKFSDRVAFKVSGQYVQGDDWHYIDPVEASEKAKFAGNPFFKQDLINATGITAAEADTRIARIGNRDFGMTRWGGEARLDWSVTPDFTTIFSMGTSTASQIELTGLGAAQASDWRYNYLQARGSYKRFFGQFYVNASDAGDTYLLRNGAPIVDKSKLWVGQLQHGVSLGERERLTYGGDLLYTVPVTEGTINGKYENDDQTTQIGGYLQSETTLSSKLDVVLAARVDHHTALPDAIFSPRAGLVIKPAQNQVFRLTYNRAFSTPSSLNQFLDLPTAVPNASLAQLGYSVRVQGTGKTGFHFKQSNGGYVMRSPFTPAAGGGPKGLVPADASAYWAAAVQVLAQQAALKGTPLPANIVQYLLTLHPTGTQIPTSYLNTVNGTTGLLSALDLPDTKPIREETSTTFEAGYQGIAGSKLLLAADVWFSRRQNLVTPLTTQTPLLLMSGPQMGTYLVTRFITDLGMSQAAAQALAGQLVGSPTAPGLATIPLGVISSSDVDASGAQLLASYANVDKTISLWGSDLSATALLNDQWSLGASVSWVNDDLFKYVLGSDTTDVTLNAPKFKTTGSLAYHNDKAGFSAEGRVRYTDGFPASSGVYLGTACLFSTPPTSINVEPCVKAFTLADIVLDYSLPSMRGVSLGLSVNNLFNAKYRSFPGVPDIGTTALLRLRYAF